MKTNQLIGLLSLFMISIAPSFLFSQSREKQPSKSSKSKTKIEVEYKKTDLSGLNWEAELQNARIIPTLDQKKIRITLPNQDTAKVVISDKKGKKILKKIAYVSPAAIDISDLKNGQYQLVIEIHNMTTVKTFTKKAKK